jgi:hypothetical protein
MTHDRDRDIHINAGVLSDMATALLAAWEERDGLHIDLCTYLQIVSAMTQEAEVAEVKLAERDAENARLREAATDLVKWVVCNIPSDETLDAKLRVLDAALNKEPVK